MIPSDDGLYTLSGGELVLWLDPAGSVMIKAIAGSDPVELGEGEVDELIALLARLWQAM